MSIKEKITIKYLNRELYSRKPLKELYIISKQEKQSRLNQMINKIQKKEGNNNDRAFPSKISQAGICFLSSAKESEILASECNKELIRLIYTVMEENTFKASISTRELFSHLFRKYHIENISKNSLWFLLILRAIIH